jgi:Ion channel
MLESLIIGLGMFALTLAVQMVLVVYFLHWYSAAELQQFRRPSHVRAFVSLQVIAALLLLVHLVNIALWAGLFYLCGEFADFASAYYHSAVNYSSLGYGDVVMSKAWRLLGPLETVNGVMMFGISTALLVAIMMRLIERRIQANQHTIDVGPSKSD